VGTSKLFASTCRTYALMQSLQCWISLSTFTSSHRQPPCAGCCLASKRRAAQACCRLVCSWVLCPWQAAPGCDVLVWLTGIQSACTVKLALRHVAAILAVRAINAKEAQSHLTVGIDPQCSFAKCFGMLSCFDMLCCHLGRCCLLHR
jgi:hypothetical protein